MAIADTFNRADNATSLGTASDGGTWTLDGPPVYGILSNQAILASNAGTGLRARRNTNQVDVDMTITINFTSFTRTHLWLAYDPATDTGYHFQVYGTPGFYKWASGAGTLQGVAYSIFATGTVVRVTYNHATGVLEAFYNGTSQGTRTDGAPITATANSWVGFDAQQAYYTSPPTVNTGESWDNFSAVSSAGPTVTYRSPHLSVVRQAVRRASVI